ncbi:ferritin-like domain-containing protein [Micromonospora sp. NPDC002389]|uniref:ferritin-like domain-containing protein n=1 Tax=unclassified Micromonospora TaxID=2617518 RepID=UPI00331AD09F
MVLIRHDELDNDAVAYRVFGVTRDKKAWRASDIIGDGLRRKDWDRTEIAWRAASRGYYAEQAGLVAAATLAANTEDAPFRFSLALATADEARHADAFYQYARAIGGDVEPDAQEAMEPLDEMLLSLPHMGRALVHTILEGLASDEFILFGEIFAGDPLARLYEAVRTDEIQHIAIGLNYLSRVSATPAGAELWREHGQEWHDIGFDVTALNSIATSCARLTGRDPEKVRSWFVRRHRARLRAAGLSFLDLEGGERK